MPHQVTLAILSHPVAGDEVMHPAANINRVNLQIPEMVDDRPDGRRRRIEQKRAPHETACNLGIEIKHVERHFVFEAATSFHHCEFRATGNAFQDCERDSPFFEQSPPKGHLQPPRRDGRTADFQSAAFRELGADVLRPRHAARSSDPMTSPRSIFGVRQESR
jgi:hypothetical protein